MISSIAKKLSGAQPQTLKNFHLADILSLVVGLSFSEENNTAALHRLVGYIMATEATADEFAAQADTAKKCVMEQLPFLKDIDLSQLYMFYKADPAQVDAYLHVWLEMQELKYGSDHALMPMAQWELQRGKYKNLSVVNDPVTDTLLA